MMGKIILLIVAPIFFILYMMALLQIVCYIVSMMALAAMTVLLPFDSESNKFLFVCSSSTALGIVLLIMVFGLMSRFV